MVRIRLSWWALALVAVACGPSFEPDATVDDRALNLVPASVPPLEEVVVDGTIRAFAVRPDALLLGGGRGLFLRRGSDPPIAIQPLPTAPDDPETTGEVRALAVRPNGRVLVAAERGLFVWNDRELVRSPLSALAPSPTLVAAGMNGTSERVAMVSGGELSWVGTRSLRLKPEAAAGPPTAIAFQGADLFVAYGDRLLRLVETATGLDEHVIELDAGTISALVTGPDGRLWVGTHLGVLRREITEEGSRWLRWASASPVLALAPDPDGNGCWARTQQGAFLAPLHAGPAWLVPLGGAPGGLALDLEGNLWAADGAGARVERQPGLGAPPPSFADEVAGFARQYCQGCHFDGASLPLAHYDEWQRNGQRILLNLRVGTMPRGNPLPPSAYRVVERWVQEGMRP